MTNQPNSDSAENPEPTPAERDGLRTFITTAAQRPAWSAERLLDIVREIEESTGVSGAAWSLLKETLPHHSEWPEGRLIALVERIETGQRPTDAGFNELLHADD